MQGIWHITGFLVSINFSAVATAGIDPERVNFLIQFSTSVEQARGAFILDRDHIVHLHHRTEIEEKYVLNSWCKPRGLGFHLVPIQRGVRKLLYQEQAM